LKLIFERCIVAPAPEDPKPFMVVGTPERPTTSNLPGTAAPEARAASSISNPAGAAAHTRTPPMAGRDPSRGNPFGANVLAASGLLLPVKVFIFIKFILCVVVESVALDILRKCQSCRRCF
jgi:hypothetical protein